MPKAALIEPYRTLEKEMIKAMLDGLEGWRPDLAFPESTSDMEACARMVIRRFILVKRVGGEFPLELFHDKHS